MWMVLVGTVTKASTSIEVGLANVGRFFLGGSHADAESSHALGLRYCLGFEPASVLSWSGVAIADPDHPPAGELEYLKEIMAKGMACVVRSWIPKSTPRLRMRMKFVLREIVKGIRHN